MECKEDDFKKAKKSLQIASLSWTAERSEWFSEKIEGTDRVKYWILVSFNGTSEIPMECIFNYGNPCIEAETELHLGLKIFIYNFPLEGKKKKNERQWKEWELFIEDPNKETDDGIEAEFKEDMLSEDIKKRMMTKPTFELTIQKIENAINNYIDAEGSDGYICDTIFSIFMETYDLDKLKGPIELSKLFELQEKMEGIQKRFGKEECIGDRPYLNKYVSDLYMYLSKLIREQVLLGKKN